MSKREVKNINGIEKELFSETERVELFISKYWLKTAIVSVLLVVIACVIYGVIKYKNDKIAGIQQKFVSAEAGDLPALIADNASVPGADIARFRLAGALLDKKDYSGAAAQLEAVFSNPEADVILRQCAAFELAGVLEQSGKSAEAAKVFTKIADETAFSAGVKAQAGCQAARLMIASGDNKGAETMLKRMIARKGMNAEDFTLAAWVSQCEQMLTALENGDFAVKAVVKKADSKK